MTRNTDLANPPAEASPLHDPAVITRLLEALEHLAGQAGAEDDLRCYTPAEAGRLLGKSANWVTEQANAEAIPYTRVGKSIRLTGAHIRQIQEAGERKPNKYSALKAAA